MDDMDEIDNGAREWLNAFVSQNVITDYYLAPARR